MYGIRSGGLKQLKLHKGPRLQLLEVGCYMLLIALSALDGQSKKWH